VRLDRKFLVLLGLAIVVFAIAAFSQRGRAEAAACDGSSNLRRLVESVCYRDQAASLTLTRAGIDYCLDNPDGASRLARFVMQQPGWQGQRTLDNVRDEIWAHCWTYRASENCIWFLRDFCNFLRRHANPIDLEYFVDWPQNLAS
jgi:hypothetical protein